MANPFEYNASSSPGPRCRCASMAAPNTFLTKSSSSGSGSTYGGTSSSYGITPTLLTRFTLPTLAVLATWRSLLCLEVAFPLLLLHRPRLVVVDHPALALAVPRDQHLLDDLRQRRRATLDRPGQRVTAQRPEPHALHLRLLPRLEPHPLVVDHDHHAVAVHDRPLLGEVERHDRDLLEVDVLPDVKLGPVGEREDPD